MNEALNVATKEFKDGLRNRWFISITLIFALLSVGISLFGGAVSGTSNDASISTIIASLSSLAVFIIPLIALLLSYNSFVAEQEGGTLLLLLTYPISRNQLLMGKFIGQGGIIALATLLGFGCAAVLLYVNTSNDAIPLLFGTFIFSAILLGLSFVSIAFVISLLSNEKSKAAGLALITWFIFSLVFDLALLAYLVNSSDNVGQHALTQLMALNPNDIFRLLNLAGLNHNAVDGALALAIKSSLSQWQLFSLLLAWVFIPLFIATLIFKKKTL